MATEMQVLTDWYQQCAEALNLSGPELDRETLHTLLDLSRESAHTIIRPAAPLTAYLVGLAVGRGATLGAAEASVTLLLAHVRANQEQSDDQ